MGMINNGCDQPGALNVISGMNRWNEMNFCMLMETEKS